MLSQEFLQSLSEKAASLFPGTAELKEDMQKRMYSLLQSSFGKLNLVTREEFDAQVVALRRAEATISTLEQKLAELETAARE